MPSRGLALPLCLLVCLTGEVRAEPPKRPDEPASYDITVRYSIIAGRVERSRQFRKLLRDLKDLGFVRDRDDDLRGEQLNEEENVEANTLKGKIPGKNARKILRNDTVVSIYLIPTGKPLPQGQNPVRVELEMDNLGSPARQFQLAKTLRELLTSIGFKEPIGYDHRGQVRLLGTLPASQVPILAEDVRLTPAGLALLAADADGPKTLVHLRTYPGGTELVKEFLLEQFKRERQDRTLPVNRKHVHRALAAFRQTQAGQSVVETIPPLQRRNPLLVEDVLLDVLHDHPATGAILTQLFADVLKDPKGPEIIAPLLRRSRGRPLVGAFPALFRSPTLVRIVEARTDLDLPAIPPAPVALDAVRRKLSPGLALAMADPGEQNREQRLEVVLDFLPAKESEWLGTLSRVVPRSAIEGRLGQVVLIRAKPADALKIAAVAGVHNVRLPRPALPGVLTFAQESGDSQVILQKLGIDRLHRAGRRGQKIKVAVIDSDFRGWDTGKTLPAGTRMLDLTIERNTDLQPEPPPGGAGQGSGTLLARAVALAAPEAELLLVRIDPQAPHVLEMFLRRCQGKYFVTLSLEQRMTELEVEKDALARERATLRQERAEVLRLFPDFRIDQIKPEKDDDKRLKEKLDRRARYLKAQADFDKKEADHNRRIGRLLAYQAALVGLRDVKVVVCGLTWQSGQRLDGAGPVSQMLDALPFGSPLWFQTYTPVTGRVWTGLFRDADNNGTMEFAPVGETLPAGNWSPEVNFLSWQPRAGAATASIPPNTRMRVSLQWYEAHDPDYAKAGEDQYPEPLAQLGLTLVRQLDPAGTRQPADDLIVAGRALGRPQRVHVNNRGATYELVMELPVTTAGRYGLMVTGMAPRGIHPAGADTIPASRKSQELRLRLFVETITGEGQVVLSGYRSDEGTTGWPADAGRIVVVGAADDSGKAQPYSPAGSAYNVALRRKPDLLYPDRLGLAGSKTSGGSSLSAGLAAGHAAALLSGRESPVNVLRQLLQRR